MNEKEYEKDNIFRNGWQCINLNCKSLNWHFALNFIKIGKSYLDRCKNCSKFHIISLFSEKPRRYEVLEYKEKRENE